MTVHHSNCPGLLLHQSTETQAQCHKPETFVMCLKHLWWCLQGLLFFNSQTWFTGVSSVSNLSGFLGEFGDSPSWCWSLASTACSLNSICFRASTGPGRQLSGVWKTQDRRRMKETEVRIKTIQQQDLQLTSAPVFWVVLLPPAAESLKSNKKTKKQSMNWNKNPVYIHVNILRTDMTIEERIHRITFYCRMKSFQKFPEILDELGKVNPRTLQHQRMIH